MGVSAPSLVAIKGAVLGALYVRDGDIITIPQASF
jgi:hypothetical protein